MKVAEIKVSYSNRNKDKFKITSSQSVYDLVINHWDLNIIEFQEEVKVVLLNRANIVLGIYEMSKGGITGTIVDIRIILAVALKSSASGIVLVHNHPSGNLDPSDVDRQITNKLKEASKLFDIILLDHIIISREGYYSFSDSGIL